MLGWFYLIRTDTALAFNKNRCYGDLIRTDTAPAAVLVNCIRTIAMLV